MQIILATALLLGLGILLVHQFWTHSLDGDAQGDMESPSPVPDPAPEELKAA